MYYCLAHGLIYGTLLYGITIHVNWLTVLNLSGHPACLFPVFFKFVREEKHGIAGMHIAVT